MHFKLVPFIVFGLVLVLAPASAQTETARQSFPERIRSKNSDVSPLIWVSSRAAVQVSQAECDRSVIVVNDKETSFLPANSLDDLVRNAKGIFRGRVIAAEQGFFSGDPSTLLQVQVDKTLRSSEEFRPDPFLYVRYPLAAFKIAEAVYCARDPRFIKGIDIGTRLLIFSYALPLDISGTLLDPEGRTVLAEDQAGRLLLPGSLKGDLKLRSTQGLNDVEDLVQSQARRVTSEQECP